MRGRVQWAWRATRRTALSHLGWHIAVAVAALLVIELLWLGLHARWTHELAINAAEALGLTAAAVLVLAVLLFLWNLLRAGDRMTIEKLQGAPTEAERERLRDLRAWVGMLEDEVATTARRVERMRARRLYWDPYRQSFELERFDQSGGLLATDRRTEPAYRALGDLRREMQGLTHLVRARWQDDMQEYIGLDPDDILNEVQVQDADVLGPLDAALRTAARELRAAMQQLDG